MPGKRSNFRVDLRLLLELGERLISRDEVAIVELVKNAYDADATTVEINIRNESMAIVDNGVGMDEKDIKEGWLTIGTVEKKKKTRTKSGRRVLGEKGLGRLAVLRLGKLITILTKKKNKPCYQLLMDWESTKERLKKNEYAPLNDMAIGFSVSGEKTFKDGHGTSVKIEKLNKPWDQKDVEHLTVFLSKLVEPGEPEGKEFKIRLLYNGEDFDIEPPEITRTPHYFMEVNLNDNNEYSGSLEWNLEKGRGEETITGKLLSGNRPSGVKLRKGAEAGVDICGPFKFSLNVWDLDAKELRGYKTTLKQWSGISLLRDGFRVVQPDVDWLGLDLRRVQNPTLRLSSNQVIGKVFITADTNPLFVDKTDREGIVNNEAFEILKSIIYLFFNLLEKKRYSLRRGKTLSRGVIFSYLDTKALRQVAKKLPKEERRDVEAYAEQLDNFRNMLEDWILGRDRMATMGLLGAKLIHEARNALMKITDNYPLIEKYVGNFEQPLKQRLERMVTGGKILAKIFGELNPFIKFKGTRKEEIDLKTISESLNFLFAPEFKKSNIVFKTDIKDKVLFKANKTDIYVMLANLVDNAIYWVNEGTAKKKVVELRADEKGDGVTIAVADNGPGVNADDIEFLFEAGYTNKPDGTGLGLSILQDIVEYYGGTIEVNEDRFLKGAVFEISLPTKGE